MKWHLLNYIVLFVFLLACSSKKAQKNQVSKDISQQNFQVADDPDSAQDLNEDLDADKELEDDTFAEDFWAQNYYHSTQLIIKNASIKEAETDIWFICQGKTLDETAGYHNPIQKRIPYLATPLTFTTEGGFVKKVFVTKGMCRELGLYQNLVSSQDKPDKHQKFRKVLQEVVVEYVYTKKAYATKLVFGTSFGDVTFVVK